MPALNYKSYGQGEPVIILHGLFGMLDNWQTIARQLSEEYNVYLLDQRNHGKSPHTERFDYSDMAEDVSDFMEKEGILKAHIIGHSMGGKTAMQLALFYPEKIESLTVVDIAPKAYKGGHQEIFEALFSIDLPTIESRKDADEQLQATISNFGVRQFLLKNLTRQKTGGYAWKMNLPTIHESYTAILSAITSIDSFSGPVLFIRGGQSKYVADIDKFIIKDLFPAADIVTIEGAGHWVHAEKPTELLEAVRRFIS